ncbi:hypothetical protein [Fimbriiglobus ruber]|uniref:Phage protein n=1 Tax=Fimbriiglobus ruber TaxID=1908690 RepID=A0A225DP02_9BACT|nr:hypothetical protein [Fimbriiglobus ruber]OWK37887.1 hypothetical protein FRUB_07007 [Fimbriiglobus ruber]
MSLSREDFLNFTIAPQKADIPELGKAVYMRQVSYDELQKCRVSSDPDIEALVYSACDEHGNPLFKLEDIAALKKKSAVLVAALALAAVKANKLDGGAVDDAKKG